MKIDEFDEDLPAMRKTHSSGCIKKQLALITSKNLPTYILFAGTPDKVTIEIKLQGENAISITCVEEDQMIQVATHLSNEKYFYIYEDSFSFITKIMTATIVIKNNTMTFPIPAHVMLEELRKLKRRTVVNLAGYLELRNERMKVKVTNFHAFGAQLALPIQNISLDLEELRISENNLEIKAKVSLTDPSISHKSVIRYTSVKNGTVYIGVEFSYPVNEKVKILPEHLEDF
jgi:hypothetical protein